MRLELIMPASYGSYRDYYPQAFIHILGGIDLTMLHLKVLLLMVRVERVELSFHPWEGYIIAVIQYPPDVKLGIG